MRNSHRSKGLLLAAICAAMFAVPAQAQDDAGQESKILSFFDKAAAYFNFGNKSVVTPAPFGGESKNNVNLGMTMSPAKGLGLRADAWSVGLDAQQMTSTAMPELSLSSGQEINPGLYIDDSNLYAGLLEAPSVKATVNPGELAKGIDLSASYVWESPRFGQFIVSTKATYLYDTAKTANLLEANLPPITDTNLLPKGTELQSSLMLTWQVGQHTASAVTHYFDSFEEIGKLNLEQLNELVGNLTTLDLQYGYNMKAGKQGQAVISVGVRNLFDARPDQVLPSPTTGIEQQGRVAYGSIKYQF